MKHYWHPGAFVGNSANVPKEGKLQTDHVLPDFQGSTKGQIISEFFFTNDKIWQISALATKKWSNQKNKGRNYGLFNVIEYLYFFDLATL